MEDGYLERPCRAIVAAILVKAIRDLERSGVYQASAVRFLTSEYGADLAEQIDIAPAALQNLAAGSPADDRMTDAIVALATQGMAVRAIAKRVFGGSWPAFTDQVELALVEVQNELCSASFAGTVEKGTS